MSVEDVFGRARAIADAVLWEGYVLYPYRRSAAKNRIRFQWGVVGPAEESTMVTTVLVEPDHVVHVRVRFLHLHRRDDGWDEAVAVDRDTTARVGAVAGEHVVALRVDAGAGAEAMAGTLRLTWEPDGALVRLRATVENPGPGRSMPREEALLHSMIGCHVLFAAEDDIFVSLLEPPDDAADAASRCAQHRCWPVLVGGADQRDLVLASPVILYDHPTVSPQSPGDFFDGTEIDEMLTLRVQTMTAEEKAEARATDPRAAAIIDRCDNMPESVQASLHGTTAIDPMPEWSEPGPDVVVVGDRLVEVGSKVTLHPLRRADAHDLFLVDRRATVARVVHDVDGAVHLAVTIDDDPAAELWDWHGRYLYFSPDEVRVVADG
jgi:hypothetical protein